MADESKKIAKRFGASHKEAFSKADSHISKAADAHKKLGQAIEKADSIVNATGVEKGAKKPEVDMGELQKAVSAAKDAHESLGDHIDCAGANMSKGIKGFSPDKDGDSDVAKSDEPKVEPKADEPVVVAKADEPVVQEDDEVAIIQALSSNPKALRKYLETRDAATAQAVTLTKAAGLPAGNPKVATYAVRKGDADLTGYGDSEGAIMSAADAAKTVDATDPNAVGKAFAKMVSIPGIKQGIGRPVNLDPSFKGSAK